MKVAVIGAGSWGTALAQLSALAGNEVMLWARRDALACAINAAHKNPEYVSDALLSERIKATSKLEEAIYGAKLILIVTPSFAMRQTAIDLSLTGLSSDVAIVVCTKGVEYDTGLVPAQIYEEVLPDISRIACLSGPNHAEEIMCNLPAATVVASKSEDTALFVQKVLASKNFRIYTSSDTLGVELCAAAKNVVAIAVGISYGMGFGDNTAAMLMTRGQAEMGRLVQACGGQALTCMGLAGTGDLIATCMSHHSRNRSFGEELAHGVTLEEYEQKHHMVVEGARACRSIQKLAHDHHVETPLVDAICAIIWEGANMQDISASLSSRSFKPEFY